MRPFPCNWQTCLRDIDVWKYRHICARTDRRWLGFHSIISPCEASGELISLFITQGSVNRWNGEVSSNFFCLGSERYKIVQFWSRGFYLLDNATIVDEIQTKESSFSPNGGDIRFPSSEPQREKINNVDSDQVQHKPDCTATGDG